MDKYVSTIQTCFSLCGEKNLVGLELFFKKNIIIISKLKLIRWIDLMAKFILQSALTGVIKRNELGLSIIS